MDNSATTRLKSAVTTTLVAMVLAGSAAIGPARSDNLVLQGSTTFSTELAQPYAGAVEAQTGHRLEVIPNKSNFGLLALFGHKADLAMISTTLEREIEILRKADPDLPWQRLKAFEITRTRAALVVHPDNPVRSARLQDVAKILSGEIANWKQLGGPDLPIRVVAVREGGGVVTSVEAALLGKAHITAPGVIRVQVGTQIVRVVEQEPGAIGITHLAIVKSSSVVELITEGRIEQVLSLVSLDEPSAAATASIEAFRRMANRDR